MKNISSFERLRKLSHQLSSRTSLDVHLLATSLVLLATSYHSPGYIIATLPTLFYLLYAYQAPTTFLRLTLPLQLIALLAWSLNIRPLVSLLLVQLPSTLLALALLPLPSVARGATVTLILNSSAPHTGSPLSLLATWHGHVAWCRLARSRGLSTRQLEVQTKEDTDFHWNLEEISSKEDGKKEDGLERKREMPEVGETMRSWNRIGRWNEDCISLDVLESWRTLPDTAADEAMALLPTLPPGPDALSRLAAAHTNTSLPTSSRSIISRFWSAVDTLPPRGAGAISAEWYTQRGRGDELLSLPKEWSAMKERVEGMDEKSMERVTLDEEERVEQMRVLQEGQKVFYRYGPPILLSLLHMGLAGGFASPRVSNVLSATGYLLPRPTQANAEWKQEKHATSGQRSDAGPTASATAGVEGVSQASSDRSFRRLLETTSWLLDVMESLDGLLPPSSRSADTAHEADLLKRGGSGWASTLRVRLLHSSVRNRLGPKSSYDATVDGVAINQEDLLATLCAFAVVPLWSLQRMGLSPTAAEREVYISTWRYIGFYNGIAPALLARCFRDAASAERFFACTASHHFIHQPRILIAPPPLKNGQVPQGPLKGPALPLLHAVAGRPPSGLSFAAHLALARFLLGPDLSTALHIPAASTFRFVRLRIALLALAMPPLFARYYPRKQWAVGLSANCKALLRRIIDWSMNNTRTKTKDGGEGLPGMEEEIKLEPEEAKRIVRQYRALMLEMGTVLVLFTLGVVGAVARIVWLLWKEEDFEAGVAACALAAVFVGFCIAQIV